MGRLFRPEGRQWYDWQMSALSEFEILLSIWHTPPSISEGNSCASPPRRLQDYAELWNEPNNRLKWNFENFDPDWSKFGEMMKMAAYWAKQCQKQTILGGMIPVNHHWLNLMHSYGALEHVDVIAVHGFPGMWWPDQPNWDWYSHWEGWEKKIAYLQRYCHPRPIWVTETGYATNASSPQSQDDQLHQQTWRLKEAIESPAECVYWYSLIDLDPAREAIEGFHVDEHEYHLGLVTYEGEKKPAWNYLRHCLQEEQRV